MALNTFKCNYLTPLHFKGLTITYKPRTLDNNVTVYTHIKLMN